MVNNFHLGLNQILAATNSQHKLEKNNIIKCFFLYLIWSLMKWTERQENIQKEQQTHEFIIFNQQVMKQNATSITEVLQSAFRYTTNKLIT